MIKHNYDPDNFINNPISCPIYPFNHKVISITFPIHTVKVCNYRNVLQTPTGKGLYK